MKEFKCKDCIHYCVCKDTVTEDNWTDDTPIEIREMFSPKYCENFFLATDVAPVQHGKWDALLKYNPKLGCSVILGYFCSLCNRDNKEETNYCPNCGAKMKED